MSSDPHRFALANASARYYPQLIQALAEDGEADTSYRRVGAMLVSADAAELDGAEPDVRALAAQAPEAGPVRRLSAQQARELFAQRIPLYAQRLGRSPRRWALSSARTRWGSCAADGSIRLSWRLVQFPLPVVDYVIAHELAHLREMNHGPRFWSTVSELCPDFEQARAWLRRHPEHPPLA